MVIWALGAVYCNEEDAFVLSMFAAALENKDDEKGLSRAQIGMVVGILLGALLLVIIGVMISRRFTKRKVSTLGRDDFHVSLS